jgi:co-chaperonin GroES (HSP10)
MTQQEVDLYMPGTNARRRAEDELKREIERNQTIANSSTTEAVADWPEELTYPEDTCRDEGMQDAGVDISDLPEKQEYDIHVHPCGYNVLIMMPVRPEKTNSGIYRPDSYRAKEQVASVSATVVEIGPDAFQDPDHFPHPETPWCKVGDYVLIHAYTGSRFQCDGNEFRIIEDRHILAVVDKEWVHRVDRINAA